MVPGFVWSTLGCSYRGYGIYRLSFVEGVCVTQLTLSSTTSTTSTHQQPQHLNTATIHSLSSLQRPQSKMNIPPKIPGVYADRTLRIVTIAAMAPAFPLLLAAGVLTGRALPALGLVPMAMSLAVSLAALTSKKSSIRTKPTADLIVAASLAFIMVLRFVGFVARAVDVVCC